MKETFTTDLVRIYEFVARIIPKSVFRSKRYWNIIRLALSNRFGTILYSRDNTDERVTNLNNNYYTRICVFSRVICSNS